MFHPPKCSVESPGTISEGRVWAGGGADTGLVTGISSSLRRFHIDMRSASFHYVLYILLRGSQGGKWKTIL